MKTERYASAAEARLSKTRSSMILSRSMRFLASLSLRLELKEATWVETMAVDDRVLYYNGPWVQKVELEELKATICHEVLHVALGHVHRRGNREPERWNNAADYAANPIVQSAGFTLWKGALINPAFDGKEAEAIYRMLEPPPAPPSPAEDEQGEGEGEDEGQNDQEGGQEDGQGQGDDGDGNGQGDGRGQGDDGDGDGNGQGDGQGDTTPDGRPLPKQGQGGGGVILDPAPNKDGSLPSEAEVAASEAEWKAALVQAVQQAKIAGYLPGGFEELLGDLLKPKADWQTLLREFFSRVTRDDYRWSRPNRRFVSSGLYLPGMYGEGAGVLVAFIDTSGSVSKELLEQFGGEFNSILEDVKPEKLYVIQVDSRVQDVQEYEPDDFPVQFHAKGRGGTAFQPAFDWVAANLPEPPDAAVYFTDYYPCDKPSDPGYPVFFADYDGTASDDLGFGVRVVIQ